MFQISCIVEGHGDAAALPVLLRRLIADISPDFKFSISPPIRLSRGKILKDEELKRAVDLAARAIPNSGAILIVFDADDDCPRDLGPRILQKAQSFRSDKIIKVVLANKEFESWFIAGLKSLAGQKRLPKNIEIPHDPEQIRDAKVWISNKMIRPSYRPTVDQPALAGLFDIQEAMQNSSSFSKLVRDIKSLVESSPA